MRVIKLGLISLVAFTFLITLFSLFFPSKVRISKAIDINTNAAAVHQQIAETDRWKNWYPGFDSAIKNDVSFPKNIALISSTDTSIVFNVPVNDNKSALSGWNIFNSGLPNTVTVQWYTDIHLGWLPWKKFSGLLLEKRYGPRMELGLEKLKKYLESAKSN